MWETNYTNHGITHISYSPQLYLKTGTTKDIFRVFSSIRHSYIKMEISKSIWIRVTYPTAYTADRGNVRDEAHVMIMVFPSGLGAEGTFLWPTNTFQCHELSYCPAALCHLCYFLRRLLKEPNSNISVKWMYSQHSDPSGTYDPTFEQRYCFIQPLFNTMLNWSFTWFKRNYWWKGQHVLHKIFRHNVYLHQFSMANQKMVNKDVWFHTS